MLKERASLQPLLLNSGHVATYSADGQVGNRLLI